MPDFENLKELDSHLKRLELKEKPADYRNIFFIMIGFEKLTPELIQLINIEKEKFVKSVKAIEGVGLKFINTESNTYDSTIDIKRGVLIADYLAKADKAYRDERKRGKLLKNKKEKAQKYQLALNYWRLWQENPSLYRNESHYRNDMIIRFEDREDKIDNHQDNLKKWIKGWKEEVEKDRLKEESYKAFKAKLNDWKKTMETQTQEEIRKAYEDEYLKYQKS